MSCKPRRSGEVVGNHVFWGATTFLPQLQSPVLLTASPTVNLARIPNIPRVLARCVVLSGWKRCIAGVQAQPPGLRPNPTFSPANSPVSPVDRTRLLTASSNTVAHERSIPIGWPSRHIRLRRIIPTDDTESRILPPASQQHRARARRVQCVLPSPGRLGWRSRYMPLCRPTHRASHATLILLSRARLSSADLLAGPRSRHASEKQCPGRKGSAQSSQALLLRRASTRPSAPR